MGEQIGLLLDKLRAEGEAVQSRLTALTPDQWAIPVYTEEGAWRGRDVLAHLVSAERGHQRLIADVSQGGTGMPVDFIVSRYNAEQVAALAEREPAELLNDLRAVRQTTIALVSGLSDEDLTRRGRHPALGEDVALADFIRIVTMHARLHLRDLTRALTQANLPAHTIESEPGVTQPE